MKRFNLFNSLLKLRLVLSLVMLLTTSGSALAEYKLQAGDSLEVSLIGTLNFRLRLPIELGGKVALPLVGPIQVAGLSLSEARAAITRELTNKIYKQPTNDGHEVDHLILPNEVVVAVAEYRPIYVTGHVAKPGEYAFRAGMTVRQAIAIAGGSDLAQMGGANTLVQAADFQSDYEALWAEFATESERIWRLRTQLGDSTVDDPTKNIPIPASFRDQLKYSTKQYLSAQVSDREQDKVALQEAIAKADVQIQVLAQKKKEDEEGNRADTQDFKKVRELFSKGITANARLSEVRRAVLLSSDQLLQTIVDISNVERQRGEYQRQLKKIDSQARIDQLRELQIAELRLAQIKARLESTSNKLRYMGTLQSSAAQQARSALTFTVYRKDDTSPKRLTAKEEMELIPGDVIEVSMASTVGSFTDPAAPSQNNR